MPEDVQVQGKQYRYSFDWTSDEYLRAVRSVTKHQRQNPVLRSLGMVLPWVLAVAVIASMASAVRGSGAAIAALPWLLILVAIAWLIRGGSAWLVARQYPEKGRGRLEVWITPEMVGSSSPISRLETPWEAIERVIEDDDFLLHYFTDRFASFLPKRLLSPSELDELRIMAQERSRYERVK